MKSYVSAHLAEDNSEKERIQNILDKMKEKNKTNFWRTKKLISILIALVCILIFLIPMIVITLIIFFSDVHASPFFCQTRVGRHGKTFKLYKFRTMVANAEELKASLAHLNEMDGPVFKIKSDPRITKFGKFLRATSLDELPQFFNVLKGDICVIGPRPPLPSEVEKYTEYQKLRLTVTPGITCLWQVQPHRNSLSFDEWVELDIEYILHRSLWVDISILFRTVWVMFKREGQ